MSGAADAHGMLCVLHQPQTNLVFTVQPIVVTTLDRGSSKLQFKPVGWTINSEQSPLATLARTGQSIP